MAAQVVHGGGEQRVRAIPGGERQRVQPDGERLDLDREVRQAQRGANLFLMFEPGITPLVIATELVDRVDVQLLGQIDHDLIGRIERVGQERSHEASRRQL